MKHCRKGKHPALQQNPEQKQISFHRLTFEALPEIWSFRLLTTLILSIPATILFKLITWTAESAGDAMTTANLAELLLSWRMPALLLLGGLLLFCYILSEIFAQIHLHADILNGQRTSIRQEFKKGICSFRRFLTPTGLFILLYIFIAVPLCGIGFSISLSRTFSIPNFIMDVILTTPLYAIAYIALILVLAWVGYHSIFAVHAVLIDGMSPAAARKESSRILKAHGRTFLFRMLKHFLLAALVLIVTYLLFSVLPYIGLSYVGSSLPQGYQVDFQRLAETFCAADTDLTAETNAMIETTISVIAYRILCCQAVSMGSYLNSVMLLLYSAYLMLCFTRYYLEFTRGACGTWPERPRKSRYGWKFLLMIGIFVLLLLYSIVAGLFYQQLFERPEPVKIVAHRAGGVEASENSLEGLYAAIERGCYGSETDVQRTKDGHYIINHDNDFKRLTGVAKTPQEMTLAEIRTLQITDTTGSGAKLPVVTLEEMLDTIKGKEKLFIELKGKTADRQMVDDLVQIIREKDCVQDVALISLHYSVIDYAETTYPEFETGTLFFAGLGNVARLNCDLLIMEEQIATDVRVNQVHHAGKQAIVWTINTPDSMYHFLNSDVDAVITDQLRLAEETQSQLDNRSDLKVIQDALAGLFN